MGYFTHLRQQTATPIAMGELCHAANVHLDLATPNFGVQEARAFNQAEQDVFPGCPELRSFGC